MSECEWKSLGPQMRLQRRADEMADKAVLQTMAALLTEEGKLRRKWKLLARVGWAIDVLLAVALAGLLVGVLTGRI